MNPNLIKVSKFISLVLRHRPDVIGLKLDGHGWADISELLDKSQSHFRFSFEELCEVVDTNEKKRFAFNEDMTKIRASQGHSIDIDLQLKPITPPDVLYHGTSEKNLISILDYGLRKMNRNHVHLSKDQKTAYNVGIRHGKPIVLTIDCKGMSEAGHLFYQSDNGVWLTDSVPAKYVKEKN